MALSTFAISTGATCSIAGGTVKTYSTDGKDIPNGEHVIDTSVTDFRVRPNITFKNREPKVSTVAGVKRWSKDKKSASLVIPILLTDGSTEYNLIRLEREVHPETTAAAALDLNIQGAQLLFDSELAAFWSTGSTV